MVYEKLKCANLDDALHEVFLGDGVPAGHHLLQEPRQHALLVHLTKKFQYKSLQYCGGIQSIHHCKKWRLLRVTQGYPEYVESTIDYLVGFSLIVLGFKIQGIPWVFKTQGRYTLGYPE